MNSKTAIAGLKVTAAQAVNDALQRHKKTSPFTDVNPTRVFLGETAYALLHEEAASGGVWAEPFPRYEDDRLEYKGMKVHCHRSASIEFE